MSVNSSIPCPKCGHPDIVICECYKKIQSTPSTPSKEIDYTAINRELEPVVEALRNFRTGEGCSCCRDYEERNKAIKMCEIALASLSPKEPEKGSND